MTVVPAFVVEVVPPEEPAVVAVEPVESVVEAAAVVPVPLLAAVVVVAEGITVKPVVPVKFEPGARKVEAGEAVGVAAVAAWAVVDRRLWRAVVEVRASSLASRASRRAASFSWRASLWAASFSWCASRAAVFSATSSARCSAAVVTGAIAACWTEAVTLAEAAPATGVIRASSSSRASLKFRGRRWVFMGVGSRLGKTARLGREAAAHVCSRRENPYRTARAISRRSSTDSSTL